MKIESGMSRRVLLTAGGLTLIAGCATAAKPVALPRRTGAVAFGASPGGTSKPGAAGPPGGRHPGRKGRAPGAGRPMYNVDDGPEAIALTIDDGPSPVYTPQILDLLAKYRIAATFSMIGVQVDQYPGIARDVAAAGHTIMNHTWQHSDLPALPAAAVRAQLDRATDAIHRATGEVPRYFRAPYGAWSRLVLQQCEQSGMTPVDWSVDPRDWTRPGVSFIVDNILRNTRTGSIILEHDGGGDRSETVAALEMVIPRLLDAGYHFRPV